MATDEYQQVLVVELDGHRFALLAAAVHEVLPAARPAPLPSARGPIKGALNLRGEVVAVLDIRARFGLAARPLRATDRLVVVESGGRRLALRVDGVVDLVPVAVADVETNAVAGSGALVAGVAKRSDGLVVIWDLERFLSADEVVALDAAMAAYEPRDRG